MAETVVCREKYGSSNLREVYITKENGDLIVMNQSPKWTPVSQAFRVRT